MVKGLADKLVLAISSRALFDLSDSHKVYLAEGVEAYRKYQIEHEEETLEPGDAFPLVRKLLGLNAGLGGARVEVVLVSRNSAEPTPAQLEAMARDWVSRHAGEFSHEAVVQPALD